MCIRRIDDLGRVAIPKEIRRMMQIREGDALELNCDGKMIVVKKHYDNALDELQNNIALLEDTELRDKLWKVFDNYIQERKGEK